VDLVTRASGDVGFLTQFRVKIPDSNNSAPL
jgi:hypothetical protein